MGFGKRVGWRKLHPHKNGCGYFLGVLHRHGRPPPHRLAYGAAQAARSVRARSPVSSPSAVCSTRRLPRLVAQGAVPLSAAPLRDLGGRSATPPMRKKMQS
eukprot:9055851-Pyramimonas_sp.AAC.1